MTKREIPLLVAAFKKLRDEASDEQALTCAYAYEEWKPDTEYVSGARVRYGEKLYRCKQTHTSQAIYTPADVRALWGEISVEEWPEWIQPLEATEAYSIGSKVTHNSKHWVSTVDNNVWEPGIYGWDEVAGE